MVKIAIKSEELTPFGGIFSGKSSVLSWVSVLMFFGFSSINPNDIAISRRGSNVCPFSVPLLVPHNWYWSFTQVVLEFQLTDTAVILMWYWQDTLKAWISFRGRSSCRCDSWYLPCALAGAETAVECDIAYSLWWNARRFDGSEMEYPLLRIAHAGREPNRSRKGVPPALTLLP